MTENGTKEHNNVAQLFNAIARRDPSKRQIKPVTGAHLDFLDDLDDDSDEEFVCEETDDDDSGADDTEDEDDTGSSKVSASSSDESIPDEAGLSATKVKSSPTAPSPTLAVADTLADSCVTSEIAQTRPREKPTSEILICILCLGDKDEPDDELIECDGCGVVVHEDCYKVVDSIFLSSGASSSSTDAWFCEACLAGVRSPYCELCPNTLGAFKRTDNNRWVHLLCALYTPGVAFNDPENLMDVTLTEIPPKAWSSHECSLCEERFFAWTGICISCDAGLCRTFFHVTCAQKHGLLSEPAVEENTADPYFAQCRQHTDKNVARQRRRNYLTAISRLKSKNPLASTLPSNGVFGLPGSPDGCTKPLEPVPMEPRLHRKLEHFRQLYEELRRLRGQPFVPATKSPLYLEHSPVAMRLFVSKAKALQLPLDLTGQSSTSDAHKAPPSGYPMFAPDFITYFSDREKKIAELLKRITSLKDAQRELQISDASASHSYNSVNVQLDAVNAKRSALCDSLNHIVTSIRQLLPELKPSPDLEPLLASSESKSETAVNLEDTFETQTSSRRKRSLPPRLSARNLSDSHRPIRRKTMDSKEMDTSGATNAKQERDGADESSLSIPDNIILVCFVCRGLQDQHLITKCDTCGKAFHIACLDPPLTRMPKRTKLYGWQCSHCTKAVATNSELVKVDVNAPRQLRRSVGKTEDPSPSVPLPVVQVPKVPPCVPLADKVSAPATASHVVPQSKTAPPPPGPVQQIRRKAIDLKNRFRPTVKRAATARKVLTARPKNIAKKMPEKPKLDPDKFDAYEYRVETNSDEEIAGLRSAKVIKFEQIRDQSHVNDSESVEQIAPLNMRYVICQEAGTSPSGQKKPTIERFRMKLKKL